MVPSSISVAPVRRRSRLSPPHSGKLKRIAAYTEDFVTAIFLALVEVKLKDASNSDELIESDEGGTPAGLELGPVGDITIIQRYDHFGKNYQPQL
jgi:hypothetical protein